MPSPLRLMMLGVLLATPVAGADFSDPDWPCIQRKQPHLSPGAMWAGPPLDQAGDWAGDPDVAALVPTLAVRRTPMDQAESLIADFASAATDRNRQLSLLFDGVFQRIDRERAEIISGIARYAGKQSGLAAGIDALRDRIAELEALDDPTFDQQDELEALQDKLTWETRIYSERAQSLTYVCESPVLLEQRAFALAQIIQRHLE